MIKGYLKLTRKTDCWSIMSRTDHERYYNDLYDMVETNKKNKKKVYALIATIRHFYFWERHEYVGLVLDNYDKKVDNADEELYKTFKWVSDRVEQEGKWLGLESIYEQD